MKLRIKGNAIRLRLTKTEVAQVASGRSVSETVAFASGAKFVYTFEPSSEVDELSARFEGQTVRVLAPELTAREWALSKNVALKAAGGGGAPSLLVEKDFQCLKPRMHEVEDESDLYYNPNEVHGLCGSAEEGPE